jgi:hypothetical protein
LSVVSMRFFPATMRLGMPRSATAPVAAAFRYGRV